MKKVLNIAILSILPCAGCFWQLYYIMSAYFAYASVTEITNLQEDTFKMPVLVFCISVGSYQQKLDQNGKSLSINRTKSQFLFPNAKSLLEASFVDLITPKQMAIINASQPQAFIGYFADQSFLTTQMYYQDYRVCFTVQPRDGETIHYNNASTSRTSYELTTNKAWHFGTELMIAFYSHYSSPFFIDSNDIRSGKVNARLENKFNSTERIEIGVTFEEVEQKLLPAPYATNCLDYHDLKLGTKVYCYKQCLMKRYNKHFGGSVKRKAFIAAGSEWERVPFEKSGEKYSGNALREDQLICGRKCARSECRFHQFKTIATSKTKTTSESSGNKIMVLAPSHPKLTVVYKPLIIMIDFITYVFSCVSFWFGWSPLMLIFSAASYLRKRKNVGEATLFHNANVVIRSTQITPFYELQMQLKAQNVVIAKQASLLRTLKNRLAVYENSLKTLERKY